MMKPLNWKKKSMPACPHPKAFAQPPIVEMVGHSQVVQHDDERSRPPKDLDQIQGGSARNRQTARLRGTSALTHEHTITDIEQW